MSTALTFELDRGWLLLVTRVAASTATARFISSLSSTEKHCTPALNQALNCTHRGTPVLMLLTEPAAREHHNAALGPAAAQQQQVQKGAAGEPRVRCGGSITLVDQTWLNVVSRCRPVFACVDGKCSVCETFAAPSAQGRSFECTCTAICGGDPALLSHLTAALSCLERLCEYKLHL